MMTSTLEGHMDKTTRAFLSCFLSASLILLMTSTSSAQTADKMTHPIDHAEAGGFHDFDFLVGQWQVHHWKLKQRLVGSHDWVEFEGTLSSRPLMNGYSNIDDLELKVPGAPYRGVALRSWDPKTSQWSIWWLDSRTPLGPLDPPMRGGFKNGVGVFYGEDTLNGRPVHARFIWSKITPTSCHWEQAYSPDGGKTWETNWIQDIKRVQ